MPAVQGQSETAESTKTVWPGKPSEVQDFLPERMAEASGIPARATKVIDAAAANGWQAGPTSLAVRFDHPDGRPIYARWDLEYDDEGKPHWRFGSARANNGQRMTYNDIFTVLEHPEALEPEPPEAPKEDDDEIPEAIKAQLAFEEIDGNRSQRYAEGWDKPHLPERSAARTTTRNAVGKAAPKAEKKWGR